MDSPRISIVDYGLGNLRSVVKAFRALGAVPEIVETADKVQDADFLVVPGVGAFKDGMDGLSQRGLLDAIRKFAAKERPMLGICLGMQLFMTDGYEFGHHEGLNLIEGSVVLMETRLPVKIPNIGWRKIQRASEWKGTLLENTGSGADVYFVHSYVAVPKNKDHVLASTVYGGDEFCAAVRKGNITGCQFHPEKSGRIGLEMLRKFCSL